MPAANAERGQVFQTTSILNGTSLLETPSNSSDEEATATENDFLVHRNGSCSLLEGKTKQRCGRRAPQRHQIHRRARRLARLLLCALLVPGLLVMSYFLVYSSARTRRTALSEWGCNMSRNVAKYVLPDNDTTLVEPPNICRQKVFLLVIVCSGVEHFAARQNIRETWGNTNEFNYHLFSQIHAHVKGKYLEISHSRLNFYNEYLKNEQLNISQSTTMGKIPVRVVFLVGRRKREHLLGNETLWRLRNEAEEYNDIVQEDFIDTYKNLTIKSVMALKWVLGRCLHATAFIMKCDDDTFVNLPNLLHYLLGGTVPLYNDTLEMYDQRSYQVLADFNRLNATSSLLMGHRFCGARPIADISSKWYMPAYMFPGDTYPSYLSGASYVMSSDVVPQLYATALNTSLIYLEDVYITGICADRAHLKRQHNPLFSFKHSRSACNFKGSITQHYMKNDAMFELYAFVTNVSIRCAPPGKYFRTIRLRKSGNCT